MTNLPKVLRERLKTLFPSESFQQLERLQSSDSSAKYAFLLRDGGVLESVLIPGRTHRTLCVSSQVGCPVRCAFCASGQNGLERNLSAAEILAQFHAVQKDIGPRGSVRNLLFMGMGEPLLNEQALHTVLDILIDPRAVGMGARRIILSTVGVIPGMRRLAERRFTPELALSLHAPEDDLRSELIPLNKTYPLDEVLDAAQDYVRLASKASFTAEYVLLKGVNDSLSHADRLAGVLAARSAKVNLIGYNRVQGLSFHPSPISQMEAFKDRLLEKGIETTLRRPAATDIEGGCGQLRRRWQVKGIRPEPLPDVVS
jgi:23S rRNA (adenine2503-C2)-methyltransferase